MVENDPIRTFAQCPFRKFLNRVNRLGFKGGDLIRGGVTYVDA